MPGRRRPAQVKPRGDGTYDVVYYPDLEGPCKVDVLYAGKPVPGRWVAAVLPFAQMSPIIKNELQVTQYKTLHIACELQITYFMISTFMFWI